MQVSPPELIVVIAAASLKEQDALACGPVVSTTENHGAIDA